MKTKYLAFAAAAALLAGCSNDEEFVPTDNLKDTPITLSANVASLTATPRAITDGKLVNATLGLFVTTETGEVKYSATNMMWTHAESTGWTSDGTVLYEGANSTQKAYAYSPYSGDVTDGVLTIDLAQQTDYLYAGSTDLTGSSLSLNMVHRLSKVSISPKMGSEVEATDGISSIELTDLPTTATWNLGSNELTPDDATSSTITTTAKDGEYSAYILPGTESFTVVITMRSGRTFTATVSASDTDGLADGTVYTVSLQVGADEVTPDNITAGSWSSDNGGNLETE